MRSRNCLSKIARKANSTVSKTAIFFFIVFDFGIIIVGFVANVIFVSNVSNLLFVSNTIDSVCFCCPCSPSRYICYSSKRLCPGCCLVWHSVSPKVSKLFSKYLVMTADLLTIIFLFRKINKNNPLPTPLLRQKQRQ